MMTYVTVYKFDCCSRKNALDFLTNVLKDLHSFIFSGNSKDVAILADSKFNFKVKEEKKQT